MRMLLCCGLTVLLILALAPAGEAITWKVGRDPLTGCDGPCDFHDDNSGNDGFAIRAALASAFVVPGDTLMVWPGDFTARVVMKSGVAVVSKYGALQTRITGFAGLDAGVSFVGCSGSTVLDGFTVFWGTAANALGGGIRAFVSDGGIRNCVIRDCFSGIGAGIYLQTSDIVVENNLFLNNECAAGGGVIAISGGGPFIRSNTFIDCFGPLGSDGVGVYAVGSTYTLDRNILYRSRGGSAIFCDGSSDVEVTCNIFYDNEYGPFGGTCVDSTGTSGNVVIDPQFCNTGYGSYPDIGDFNVCATSLARVTSCGPIGYIDPAGEVLCGPCEATSAGANIESTTWGYIKALYH